MTTATRTIATTTEIFDSFARTVSAETVDRNDIVFRFSKLEPAETFNALVLAFDTLVNSVHTDGVTPRSASLISALDAISIRFMSAPHLVSGKERRIGNRIENAVCEGLRGRPTGRGFVPYTAVDLVCVLIAGVHGFSDPSAVAAKEIASAVTEGFTVFRSAGTIVIPPAK